MVNKLGVASCLSAAELRIVCLFRSWHPLLLGPTPSPEYYASYLNDFQAAKLFNRIMDTVSARTG